MGIQQTNDDEQIKSSKFREPHSKSSFFSTPRLESPSSHSSLLIAPCILLKQTITQSENQSKTIGAFSLCLFVSTLHSYSIVYSFIACNIQDRSFSAHLNCMSCIILDFYNTLYVQSTYVRHIYPIMSFFFFIRYCYIACRAHF